jgi:hypothetical protein
MPFILEGIVSSCDAAGAMHLAAMGPEVLADEAVAGRLSRLILKPFAESQTAVNLARHPEGVFHAIDDVLLLARVVTGALDASPAAHPATLVRGWILDEAAAAHEFRITTADRRGERQRLEARVVATHPQHATAGFNRARHAVVEAAILATRLHLMNREAIGQQLTMLRRLVEKTAGPREEEAFEVIEAFVACRTGGQS